MLGEVSNVILWNCRAITSSGLLSWTPAEQRGASAARPGLAATAAHGDSRLSLQVPVNCAHKWHTVRLCLFWPVTVRKWGPGSDHAVLTGIKFGLDRILDSDWWRRWQLCSWKKKPQHKWRYVSLPTRLMESPSHRQAAPAAPPPLQPLSMLRSALCRTHIHS